MSVERVRDSMLMELESSIISNDEQITYLQSVRERLEKKQEPIYKLFLLTLYNYTNRKIEPLQVRRRMETLLRGHDDLLAGVQVFLPDSSKLTALRKKQLVWLSQELQSYDNNIIRLLECVRSGSKAVERFSKEVDQMEDPIQQLKDLGTAESGFDFGFGNTDFGSLIESLRKKRDEAMSMRLRIVDALESKEKKRRDG